MHVTVVGAGPLGLFYGGHACHAGATVTLVRRRVASAIEEWEFVSRLTGRSFRCSFSVTSQVPKGVDVVVIAVRGEQLTEELLRGVLRSRPRAVVCLTPDLGGRLRAVRDEHPELVAAMPAIAAETEGRRLFYWASPPQRPLVWAAPRTLVERRGANPALHEFVALLGQASVPVSWTEDAAARGVANTVVLFPVHVAIYVSPQMRSWLYEPKFCKELAGAVARARSLAKVVGPTDNGLQLLAWWLSGERRLRWTVSSLLFVAPQLVQFLEHHFGPKLAAQHAVLLRDISELAERRGFPCPLPDEWVRRVLAAGGTGS